MNKSAQHAEVTAAAIAIAHSQREKQNIIHIFTDSWCVANGIAIWSGKWKQNNWKIAGKDIWSKEAWIKTTEAAKMMKIIVFHVDAHTGKTDEMHKYNDTVDKLAAAAIKLKAIYKTIPQEGNKIKIKRDWIKISNPDLTKEVHPQEILKLHEELGHMGTHALKQWFDQRNIKSSWSQIKSVIKFCNNCPSQRKDLHVIIEVQWDLDGTLIK